MVGRARQQPRTVLKKFGTTPVGLACVFFAGMTVVLFLVVWTFIGQRNWPATAVMGTGAVLLAVFTAFNVLIVWRMAPGDPRLYVRDTTMSWRDWIDWISRREH